MTFTDQQIRKLKARLRATHVRERESDGRTLHYLEGWHVVAEANRIFGFDGWDRETVASQCVFQKQTGSGFAAAYLTRVRVSVRAGIEIVQREGLGSGEATAATPGQAHDRAAKAAETDATKRALSTFGNPFGLSLYGGKAEPRTPAERPSAAPRPVGAPAPSVGEPVLLSQVEMERAFLPVRVPKPGARLMQSTAGLASVDKSVLAMAEPRRQRDLEHLRFVARQPCLACGRTPSQAHHVRFAQPRALSRKVSDEFTVPLCATHHHELHRRGDEREWWAERNLEPLAVAEELWRARRSGLNKAEDGAVSPGLAESG